MVLKKIRANLCLDDEVDVRCPLIAEEMSTYQNADKMYGQKIPIWVHGYHPQSPSKSRITVTVTFGRRGHSNGGKQGDLRLPKRRWS